MTNGSANRKPRIMIDYPRSPMDGSPYAPHLYELLAEIHAVEDAFEAAQVLERMLIDAYCEGMNDANEYMTSLLPPLEESA